jgi:Tfp pilus assembly PilM family ATPase
MAFGMMNAGTAPIAIEFGVGSLKALQVSPGESPSLIAAACLETPEDVRRDHDARLTYQCEQVGKLLKGAGFKGKRVTCSIPAPFTLVQHIQVQKSDGVSMTDQVMSHLQSQLHCDPTRVVVRHVEVADVSRSGGSRTEVICFAVARDMVMRIMSALRTAKYEVIGVHSEHIALARAFDHVTKRESDSELTSMYLDLGVGTSKIVLAHGRDIVFAKTIHVAGVDLDTSIAKELNCDLAEARARRLAMGRDMPATAKPAPQAQAAAPMQPPPMQAGAMGGANATPSSDVEVAEERRIGATPSGMTEPINRMDTEIEKPLEGPTSALASEVSMCLRYHERLFPDRPVKRAVFVGGEARDLALCQRIAKLLRLPAQIADPLACLQKTGKEPMRHIDFSAPQPGWTVPFGLCFAPRNL